MPGETQVSHAGVGEGSDEAGEAFGLRVVLPGYGDGGLLEGRRAAA